MSGITITDVKVVGTCSEHGGDHRYKDGSKVTDKDISCIECSFKNYNK
jgi:hypothetical protein